MKVCDLTQSYAPTGGGVRTYIHAKRDYIRERTSAEHLLIVPGTEDGVAREDRATTRTIAAPRIPGSGAYRFPLRLDKVLRILRRERPDVIEVHCAYGLPWTAFLHRRRVGGRVVGCYMTDVPTAYVEPAVARLGGRAMGRTARRVADRYARGLYTRCDATIAISPALAERLASIGVDNVSTIPLGVDLETFHPARRDPAIRRRFGAGPDEPLLIYAGRLDREKRPDQVVDAFERLSESMGATLVLVGEGPLRGTLVRRAERNGRIHVLPFESDRDRLAGLLASADLYVSAMPHETFGLSVIEAQASGLPVVGVRSGAMVDRVSPDDGVLVPPGRTDRMARAIADRSIATWRRMGRSARRRVEAEFSWHATFDRVFALYDRLGAGRGAEPVPHTSH